jgi:uncharacterized protein YggL (DUF469 family)
LKPKKKRRIRKKLYIGEFQMFGISFSFEPVEGLEFDDALFCDNFIDLIESLDLLTAGCDFDFHVEAKNHKSVTEEQRDIILLWLSSRPDVKNAVASDFYDIFYLPQTPEQLATEQCVIDRYLARKAPKYILSRHKRLKWLPNPMRQLQPYKQLFERRKDLI